MADISNVSDANSDEISRMITDMDNLEKDLFKISIPSSLNNVKNSNVQMVGENKKRTVFKDHDDINPLPDLLSEEENDFLEDKKYPIISNSKSSIIEDLFKIKSSSTSTSVKSNTKLDSKPIFEIGNTYDGYGQKTNDCSDSAIDNTATLHDKASSNEQEIRNKSNSNDKLKILGTELRYSLLEDSSDNKSHSPIVTTITNKDVAKVECKISKIPTKEIENDVKIKKSFPGNTTNSTFRRLKTKKDSRSTNDPLGLFSYDNLFDQDQELVTEKSREIKNSGIRSTKLENNLPEWLSGVKKLEQKKPERNKEMPEHDNKLSENLQKASRIKENIEPPEMEKLSESLIHDKNNTTAKDYPEHFSFLVGTQLEQEAAIIAMQQQEQDLKTATVLMQQNEQLNKAVNAQQFICSKQEEQFTTFLKIQLDRQFLLEKQLKAHQERIDHYVQMLMTKSISVPAAITCSVSNKMEVDNELTNCTEKDQVDNLVRKLQLEKLELESTLSTVSERHENEIKIQAESYRRQISFLQETLTRLEEQIRQETEFLEAYYMAKFEKLRTEKVEIEDMHKEEINNLKKAHAQHTEEIFEQHSQNIKLLQKENCEMIENILKSKQRESIAIESMTTQKAYIENMLQKADNVIDNIKEIQEKIKSRDDDAVKLKELHLKEQENSLKDQKVELEKQNNILQEQYNKFVERTEKLDVRLTQLIIELQKQSMHCNQMHEMLEEKAASLSKERELFEEKVKWDRNYLEALKESQKNEQERVFEFILKEKESLAVERAQVAVLNKLKITTDDVARTELETAIKVAQEAITSANRERLRWQEKISNLEARQQHLQEKENVLILHAKELDNFTQSALAKRKEGIKALRDAKHLEDQHKEKADQLEIQLKSLVQREKKLAVNRFNAARGRLTAQASNLEKPEQDGHISDFHSLSDVLLPRTNAKFMNIIDPHLIKIKLSLDEHLETTNQVLQEFDGPYIK